MTVARHANRSTRAGVRWRTLWPILALLGATAAIGVAAHISDDFPGDSAAYHLKHDKPALGQPIDAAVDALGALARPAPAVVVVLVLALIAYRAVGGRGLVLAPAMLGAPAVSSALKPVFGVPELESRFRYPVDTFPSGHAAYAAAAGGFAAWLALRAGRPRLAAALVILIAAVGLARVAAGVHWPSDVVAGWTLGTAWLLAGLLAAGLAVRPAK